MRQWYLVGVPADRGKANMAGKDKGGRAAKTAPSKTAKQKRQAKKEKKSDKGGI